MKTILLHASNFNTFWAHYCVHEDPDFINKLAALGYRLVLSSESKGILECDHALFVEVYGVGMHRFRLKSRLKHMVKKVIRRSRRDLYKEFCTIGARDRLALILFEAVIHLPENHSPKLHSMFPKVFTWNDELVDGKHILKFCLPQPLRWPEAGVTPYRNKKLLINVSSNKVGSHPLELYSARHSSIRYFNDNMPAEFDLYGFGWNSNGSYQYRTYRSVLKEHKSSAYSKYRFALCYENSCIPGNIDEKIFECMRSDCVPIFLGAPNVKDYVDKEAFIDRRDFSSEEELGKYLKDMTEGEYNQYREAIREYLSSPRFARFLSPAFAETIVRGLESSPQSN